MNNMLPLERKLEILKRTDKEGKVQIEQLVEELNVSGMTIRRDLAQLEKEGKVIRTHGGAVAVNPLIPETPYQNKSMTRVNQKHLIAKYAASLIPEGAQILLDSGTTTLEIAKVIKNRDDLTIVTNDLKIAAELIESPSEIICTGGTLQRGIGSFVGPHAQDLLNQIRVDLLFMGTHAINLEKGLTAPTMEKALIKRLMADAATTTWVVADSQKFNKSSFSQVCSLEKIEGIITDAELTPEDTVRYGEITSIYTVKENEVSHG